MNKKIFSILVSILIGAFLLGAVGMALLTKSVHEKPEVEMCLDFLMTWDGAVTNFGAISSVEYDQMQAASFASSFTDDTTHGHYCYKIFADGKKRLVTVYWRNNKQGNNFHVEKVELMMGSDKPKVIYKK